MMNLRSYGMSEILALGEDSPQLPDDQSHWIGSGAIVVGKVRLGKNVGVWFGTVLRGDNELIDIGANTNLQEHVMVHTDMGFPLVVGEGCTIGHRALLHGCQIGNNTLIGMGAMIMNGAVIGDNCLIGAGTLITEGTQIPDGALVIGSPGKIKRAVTEKEIQSMKISADHYVGAMNKMRDARKHV